MKITHCKLKKSTQKRLLEFFVLEVTARSAADILDIQPNSAILFYHKIRQVIDYHLSLEADEIFEGKIELDESYFERSLRSWLKTLRLKRYTLLLKGKLSQIVGFIPILIAVMMPLM